MALPLGTHLWSVMDQLRFQPVTRRIRVSASGSPVADTRDAFLVWEPHRVVPWYAVPEADMLARLDACAGMPVPEPLPPVLSPEFPFAVHLAPGQSYDVHTDAGVAPAAAYRPDDPDLGGRVVLEWAPFDWVEEAAQVMGHPHDPFKRIDVLPGDRHVVVSLDGQVLADSTRPVVLYETMLPPRWYLPREDTRMELLVESSYRSICAYKGRASYWSLATGDPEHRNIAWTYPTPLHDAEAVRDLVCFFAERSDHEIDGVTGPRPRTAWSRPPG